MTTATLEAIATLLKSLDEEVQSEILSRHKQNLMDMFLAPGGDTEIEEAAARSFLSDTDDYCMGTDNLHDVLDDALKLALDDVMSVYVWEIFLERAIVKEALALYEPEAQEGFLNAFPELFEGNEIIKNYAEKIELEPES
jgi:hypothetical protein